MTNGRVKHDETLLCKYTKVSGMCIKRYAETEEEKSIQLFSHSISDTHTKDELYTPFLNI